MEAEKDKNKLDPWKLKHFEPIWGEKREPKFRLGLHCMNEPRTGGAVTRSSLRLRLESTHEQYTPELYQRPVITTDKIEETDVPTRINPPVPETSSIISDTSHDPLIKDITTSEVENRLEQPSSNNIVETVITNGIIEKESNEEEEECHKEELEKAESPVETETPMEINQTNISEVLEVEIQPDEESKEPEVIASPSTEEKIHLEEQIIEVLAPVVEEITTVVTSVTPTMIVTTSDLEHSQEFTVSEQIECQSQDDCDTITELTMSLSEVSEIQVLQDTDDHFDAQFDSSRTDSDKMFEISECENAAAVESISAHDSVKSDSIILEEHDVINVQINADAISATSADSEPIPDAMEIDSETLQRIHELEVSIAYFFFFLSYS